MVWLSILVMFIHIGAATAWIGGLAYLRLIVLPTLLQAAPPVRGPIVADLGPRTVRFLLRSGEITIVAGIGNFFLMNGMEHAKGSHLWATSIGLGLVGAVAIYVIGQAVTRPTTLRISASIKEMMADQGGPDAAAELEALGAKQRKMLNMQLAIGTLVLLLMAAARFT